MNNDIKEILFSQKELNGKIKEVAAQINKDYEGKDVIFIGILKGSVMFMADLLKEIKIPCQMDFMAVSSYGNSAVTSGVVRILKDLDFEIRDKNIIIVEDIIDSGITLQYLMKCLKARKPKSIEIACLLNKPERRKADISVKYLGADVPDYFLVGYGLDYAEKYRNLPFIGVLKEEIYK